MTPPLLSSARIHELATLAGGDVRALAIEVERLQEKIRGLQLANAALIDDCDKDRALSLRLLEDNRGLRLTNISLNADVDKQRGEVERLTNEIRAGVFTRASMGEPPLTRGWTLP